jgi:hypothetical protein
MRIGQSLSIKQRLWGNIINHYSTRRDLCNAYLETAIFGRGTRTSKQENFWRMLAGDETLTRRMQWTYFISIE